MTIPREAVVPFVRAVGAVHSGVGAYLLFPPGTKGAPVIFAIAAAVVVFRYGRVLSQLPSTKGVLAKGYALPLALVSTFYVNVHGPADLADACRLLKDFVVAVYATTPLSAYLAALSYASFAADRNGGFGLYR